MPSIPVFAESPSIGQPAVLTIPQQAGTPENRLFSLTYSYNGAANGELTVDFDAARVFKVFITDAGPKVLAFNFTETGNTTVTITLSGVAGLLGTVNAEYSA
jgi:hypothetical protein